MIKEKMSAIKSSTGSIIILSIFILIPTIKLKTKYILAISKLPLWKEYEYFRSLFQLINEAENKN